MPEGTDSRLRLCEHVNNKIHHQTDVVSHQLRNRSSGRSPWLPEYLTETHLEFKIKLSSLEHQFVKKQQDLFLHSWTAIVAKNVADVVGRTIRLLPRVSRRGVGERQQGRHWHGWTVSGHACGDLREQWGEAEVGYVRGDSRWVGDGHRWHIRKQGEAGLAKTHRTRRGEDGAKAVVERRSAALVGARAGKHLVGKVLEGDVAGKAGVSRWRIRRVEGG